MFLSIAVDGPAGSGKSTVAKAVAKNLGITYLDTGAMYRMVTLDVLRNKVSIKDMEAIKTLLDKIKIEFRTEGLFLNNDDVTTEIRNDVVANHVSDVAAIGIVREKMVAMQREIAKGQSIIMDGRDIGTHVLKDASHKFYLVASVEERAKRRLLEFEAQGIDMTLEELMKDIERRDGIDSNREINPLKQAHDAILVDTTKMTIEEVINFIMSEVNHA
ncbi:(d)CMP kinase [Acidaminobacter sp. JC074]|uniref:(d)CMP kinase n=1 Tax=Acidaminobacter sp. JC074 TaxID=2530199 RepID=UPI001F106068|nr:(d)CMP kinase [Acidaminobacter sp. JC074]MCH4888848.1 (d)CMP kinase [Acidaminobacter sp. JC074]